MNITAFISLLKLIKDQRYLKRNLAPWLQGHEYLVNKIFYTFLIAKNSSIGTGLNQSNGVSDSLYPNRSKLLGIAFKNKGTASKAGPFRLKSSFPCQMQ